MEREQFFKSKIINTCETDPTDITDVWKTKLTVNHSTQKAQTCGMNLTRLINH